MGRVEMWRGGCRLNISVAASFVWRCLSSSTVSPFPHPAHRTGQADFPHPACMGLSLSMAHHASFVILYHSVLFVRPVKAIVPRILTFETELLTRRALRAGQCCT